MLLCRLKSDKTYPHDRSSKGLLQASEGYKERIAISIANKYSEMSSGAGACRRLELPLWLPAQWELIAYMGYIGYGTGTTRKC
jgi:hypothetical protein